MGKTWFVYICDRDGMLYTGITTEINHRMKQHRGIILYSETFEDKHMAAMRERQIKGWRREKKLELVRRVSLP